MKKLAPLGRGKTWGEKMTRPIRFMAWDRINKCMTENVHLLDTFNEKIARPKEYDLYQFTGLLDKEGKEIYEGHIVKVENKHDSVRHHAKKGEGVDFIAPFEWKHSCWYIGYGTFNNWCLGQLWEINTKYVKIIGHITEEENNDNQ